MWPRRRFISASTALAASVLAGCRQTSLLGPEIAPPSTSGNADGEIEPTDDAAPEVSHDPDRPLSERALAKGLLFGSALTLDRVTNNSAYRSLLAEQCSVLVPESELKFRMLRPNRDQFNFARADLLLEIAEAHGMLFRGHTLVWHHSSGLADWLSGTADTSNVEQLLVEHIQTVVGRYKGRIHSWDVVNEAIDGDSSRSDKLRLSPWLEWVGPHYIELAFRAAAEADDSTLLVYNDYGTDYATPWDESRRTAMLGLLEGLLARGTPIHAVGIQAHLRADETRFNSRVLREFFRELRQLGLQIFITELDVSDHAVLGDMKSRDGAVADTYRRYLEIALDEPATKGVITWGLADHYSWLRRYVVHEDGSAVRPLPYDSDLRRKTAWSAVADCLDGAASRGPYGFAHPKGPTCDPALKPCEGPAPQRAL